MATRSEELFVRQIRVVRLHMILPGMKNQRFPLPPAVVNHFTEEYYVIPTLKFSNYPADKVSGRAFQQRAAFDVVAAIDFGEPVRELRGKSA